ncbi:hypothetical protein D9M70_503070 [compost metagenome]
MRRLFEPGNLVQLEHMVRRVAVKHHQPPGRDRRVHRRHRHFLFRLEQRQGFAIAVARRPRPFDTGRKPGRSTDPHLALAVAVSVEDLGFLGVAEIGDRLDRRGGFRRGAKPLPGRHAAFRQLTDTLIGHVFAHDILEIRPPDFGLDIDRARLEADEGIERAELLDLGIEAELLGDADLQDIGRRLARRPVRHGDHQVGGSGRHGHGCGKHDSQRRWQKPRLSLHSPLRPRLIDANDVVNAYQECVQVPGHARHAPRLCEC